MEVQPSLVLLQKTLLNIEGLGRQLYPELNLWDTAQPFLEEWVEERYSPQSVFKRLQRQAPSWLEQLPQLPEVMLENLQQARDFNSSGAIQQTAQADKPRERSKLVARRRRMAIAAGVGMTAIVLAAPGAWESILQAPPVSWLLAGIAAILLWPRTD
jgi:ubiquinone biosynthesis protein